MPGVELVFLKYWSALKILLTTLLNQRKMKVKYSFYWNKAHIAFFILDLDSKILFFCCNQCFDITQSKYIILNDNIFHWLQNKTEKVHFLLVSDAHTNKLYIFQQCTCTYAVYQGRIQRLCWRGGLSYGAIFSIIDGTNCSPKAVLACRSVNLVFISFSVH